MDRPDLGQRIIGGIVRRSFACHRIGLGAQDHAVVLNLGHDAALNLALGNGMQHVGIGRWRLGAKIAVSCGQIAEILRNRRHRVKGLFKAFQGAGEGSIRNRENFTCTDHEMVALYQTYPCNVTPH